MDRYVYKPQDWQNYDDELDNETNIELGGVVTPERMEHIEEGIVHANISTSYIIESGDMEMTNEEVEDGRKIITITTPSLEPRQNPLDIRIIPDSEESTSVDNKNDKKTITIKTPNVEPKWPDKLDIVLKPSEVDIVEIEDEDDTRTICIKTTLINNCLTRPYQRDIVIYINDWREVDVNQFEADIHIEAEILPSSFVKFTKGLEITNEQLQEIEFCGVQIIEKLDGTFKALARVAPTIDLPFHVTIL